MLFNKIKTDRINAKKERHTEVAEILTTLLSEIQRQQSRPTDIPTDDEVAVVVKKYIANIKEMQAILPNDSKLQLEQLVVEKYLPTQLSEEEIINVIENICESNGYFNMQDMGKVMKSLKETYGNSFDAKFASTYVKKMLS